MLLSRRSLIINGKLTDPNNHEWVDFRLPSGKIWAKYSVGGYNGYGGDTYKFGTNDNNVSYYDGLAPLPLSHDTANVVMGGDWQMSMYDDWVELKTYCEVKSVSNNIAAIGRIDNSTNKLIYMKCSDYWNSFSGGSTTNAAFGGISSYGITPSAYYGSRSNLKYVHGILKKSPNRTETISLLHFDNENDPAEDACGNTWSYITSPSLTTSSKFGAKCWYQNNSSTISLNTGLVFQDFTIEVWIKPTTTNRSYNWSRFFEIADTGLFFAHGDCGNSSRYTYWKPNNSNIYISSSNFSINTWLHVVITYKHLLKKAKLYINGTIISSSDVDTSQFPSTITLKLGSTTMAYLDEFRFSKGIIYTHDFTPPTNSFS